MINRAVDSISCAIAALALISISQPVLAQTEQTEWSSYTCVRIEPGKGAEFEKLMLDTYPKIIRLLIEEKKLVWWGFYRAVAPAGEGVSCNYLFNSISLGAPMAPAARAVTEANMKKAGVTMTLDHFVAKRNAIAKTITTGISMQIGRAGKMEKGDYWALNYMKSLPGKAAEYAKFEREVWLPMVAEEIAQGGLRKGWSALQLWYPWGEDVEFDYITADIFRDWESAWKPQTLAQSAVSKAFPGKSYADVVAPVAGLRKHLRRELFRTIEVISAPAPGQAKE